MIVGQLFLFDANTIFRIIYYHCNKQYVICLNTKPASKNNMITLQG